MPNSGWIAQLVEQRTENPRVGGSIPSPASFLPIRTASKPLDLIAPELVNLMVF